MSDAQVSEPSGRPPRSPWVVTWRVYKALLIREAVSRVVGNRMAWFWAVVEPMAAIFIMLAERLIRSSGREIQGIGFPAWVFVGLIAFQLFRSYVRLMGAVDSNKGLYTYRQIKPIDTVVIRSVYDFLFLSLILLMFIGMSAIVGAGIVPSYPIEVIIGWLLMWGLSLSLGVLASAIAALVEEVKIVIRLITIPLFVISGVFIPLTTLPPEIISYLMYNPIVSVVEYLREGFFHNYSPLPGTSPLYVLECILIMLVLGLILHLRFKNKIIAK